MWNSTQTCRIPHKNHTYSHIKTRIVIKLRRCKILRACQALWSINWPRDEMDNISQTTFSNVIPPMIKVSMKLVPNGSICNIDLDNGLVPTRRQTSIWTTDGYITDVYLRHSASKSLQYLPLASIESSPQWYVNDICFYVQMSECTELWNAYTVLKLTILLESAVSKHIPNNSWSLEVRSTLLSRS